MSGAFGAGPLAQGYDEPDPTEAKAHWERVMVDGDQATLDTSFSVFKSKLSRSQLISHLLLEQWFRNRGRCSQFFNRYPSIIRINE